jgi:replicative DNA helicase
MLGGGFYEKTLTVFLGMTSIGKSLIMASLATNCVMNNKNVLIVTLEMSEQKYAHRIIANAFDTNIYNLKDIPKEDYERRCKAIQNTFKSRLKIKQYSPKSVNANNLKYLLRELKLKKKFVPDILFIDYLEIMRANNSNKTDNTFSEIKKITEDIRGIGVEFDIPVISAVQTIRSAFGSPDLELKDVSQSIGVPQTADVVIGITQPDDFKRRGKYVWFLLKNRDGESGKKLIMDVDYGKMRVTEDTESNKEEPQKDSMTIVQNILKKSDEITKKTETNWE